VTDRSAVSSIFEEVVRGFPRDLIEEQLWDLPRIV
jgi:hypothetical protein